MFKCPAVPVVDAESRASFRTLVHDNPWLIPAIVAIQVVPVTVAAHGYWKTQQLKKQLQIERERTKQMQSAQVRPGIRPLQQLNHHFRHE